MNWTKALNLKLSEVDLFGSRNSLTYFYVDAECRAEAVRDYKDDDGL